MGWEKRGDCKYFYTAERVNGRVVKRYWPGDSGEAMAKLRTHVRENLAEQRESDRTRRKHWQQIDDSLGELAGLAHAAFLATATLEGFHFHKGEWRRRRVQLSPATGRAKPSPERAECNSYQAPIFTSESASTD